MLWPHDDVARDAAIVTATTEFGRSVEPIMPDKAMREMFLLAADARPLGEVQRSTESLRREGAIAGKILLRVVGRMIRGEPNGSLGKVQQELADSFLPSDRTGKNTIKAIWGNYRRVSHFWAAFMDHASTENDWTFPCRVDRLSNFFTMADSFRVYGEENGPPQHPSKFIFRKDECLRIPDEIKFLQVALASGHAVS
jgi:hypothetical protein